MSLVEAVANVVVGYGVAVVTQMLVFPLFGLTATLAQNLASARSSRRYRLSEATRSAGCSRRSAFGAGGTERRVHPSALGPKPRPSLLDSRQPPFMT